MERKKKSRTCWPVAGLAALLLLFSARTGFALSLTQQFSESFYGPGVDILAQGFDPGLGNLDSVAISISGDVFYKCVTEVYGTDPYDPHPYATYDIFGSTAFSLSSPLDLSQFSHDFSAPQAASDVSIYANLFVAAFGDSVVRTDSAFLDFVSGQSGPYCLASFLDHTSSFSVSNVVGPAVVVPVVTSSRIDLVMSITYNYTPFEDPPPSPTPEPATWLLFSTGLAGLFRMRKK